MEHRPYRDGMTFFEVFSILDELVANSTLDSNLVEDLKKYPERVASMVGRSV